MAAGSLRSPQVVKLLSHLLRHIPNKILIVWDGLKSHYGRLVWDFVDRTSSQKPPEN
jgi:hypothetical protein